MRRQEEDKEINYDPMQHFDEGGIIGQPESSDILDFLQPKGSGMIAPSMTNQSPSPQAAHISEPTAVTQKAAPAMPNPPQEAPQNALNEFLTKQNAGLEKYGPEQQLAVQQALIKQRQGPVAFIGNGMRGFADALSRAGGSESDYQKQGTAQQNELANETMGTMEKAQGGKMAQLQAKMKLSQEDPNSALSKIAQKAYGSTLKTMPGGEKLTDSDISKIPASMIASITSGKIDLSKALAEIENTEAYRESTIGLQKATLENTKQHERSEETNANAGRQQDAAKTLAGQGILRKGMNMITPSGRQAQNLLQAQAAGVHSFDSVESAESAGLPKGTRVSIGGRMATIQ